MSVIFFSNTIEPIDQFFWIISIDYYHHIFFGFFSFKSLQILNYHLEFIIIIRVFFRTHVFFRNFFAEGNLLVMNIIIHTQTSFKPLPLSKSWFLFIFIFLIAYYSFEFRHFEYWLIDFNCIFVSFWIISFHFQFILNLNE